jgi:hypothetical protein
MTSPYPVQPVTIPIGAVAVGFASVPVCRVTVPIGAVAVGQADDEHLRLGLGDAG